MFQTQQALEAFGSEGRTLKELAEGGGGVVSFQLPSTPSLPFSPAFQAQSTVCTQHFLLSSWEHVVYLQ